MLKWQRVKLLPSKDGRVTHIEPRHVSGGVHGGKPSGAVGNHVICGSCTAHAFQITLDIDPARESYVLGIDSSILAVLLPKGSVREPSSVPDVLDWHQSET